MNLSEYLNRMAAYTDLLLLTAALLVIAITIGRRRPWLMRALIVIVNIGNGLSVWFVYPHPTHFMIACGGMDMAIGLWCGWFYYKDWLNRRRQKVLKMIGEKSRALREALVRTMRERARPRVVRPVRLPA